MSSRPVVFVAGGGTGGHLMPALAIATQLREQHPEIEPYLVGAQRGVESRILPSRDFRFTLLPSQPLHRRAWWRNARWPFVMGRLASGLAQLFRTEAPVAVLGTGGYASLPVVWWAARHGIPTAIQEQNAYPGLASRLLARQVRHVYLGVSEAEHLLQHSRTTRFFDTGNPITPPDPTRRPAAMERLGFAAERPVLLITGGSQGSRAINQAVASWLTQRGPGDGWQVLWITGRVSYAEFAKWEAPPAVRVLDFLDPMADAYAVADLVISRAGMMTVAELCAWGLPSVLIPLPSAAADHQTHNARALESAGGTCMFLQSRLAEEGLAAVAEPLMADGEGRRGMAARALARGRPHAARDIVSLFTTLFAS